MRHLFLVTALLASATASAQTSFLPLGEGEGMVFCPDPGCTVPFTPDGGGEAKPLALGAKVKLAGGDAAAAAVAVEVGGKKGTLPAAQLLTEATLHRSPDGQAAVFAPPAACGAGPCKPQIWVLTPSNLTVVEGSDASPPVVAWHPEGKRVAIGAPHLFTVEMPGLETSQADKYGAPAFAPDGKLYVRALADGAVYRVEGRGALKKIGAAPAGRLPREHASLPPVTFEENGKKIVATYPRARKDAVVRYPAP